MPRFCYPLRPAEFEILTEWWTEAGMTGFVPSGTAYHSTSSATLVPLRQVEPPFRFPEHPLDSNGFSRDRLISILRGFVDGAQIEAVLVVALPTMEFTPATFGYRVCNGLHRFYASVAAGYSRLPVVFR